MKYFCARKKNDAYFAYIIKNDAMNYEKGNRVYLKIVPLEKIKKKVMQVL